MFDLDACDDLGMNLEESDRSTFGEQEFPGNMVKKGGKQKKTGLMFELDPFARSTTIYRFRFSSFRLILDATCSL